MTHTQALIHIIVGSILFTSSTYDLLYDKKRQLLSGFLTGFLIIATYNFTNVMQIIAATGFFLALMTLYTMEPYGKFLYHLTICTHFWLGPIKCISYMYTSGAYYYMEGVVIHDGIPYKDLMREDDPLNRFFAPIIALFIVLTPRLYQMYTYKQRYNRACEKSRN